MSQLTREGQVKFNELVEWIKTLDSERLRNYAMEKCQDGEAVALILALVSNKINFEDACITENGIAEFIYETVRAEPSGKNLMMQLYDEKPGEFLRYLLHQKRKCWPSYKKEAAELIGELALRVGIEGLRQEYERIKHSSSSDAYDKIELIVSVFPDEEKAKVLAEILKFVRGKTARRVIEYAKDNPHFLDIHIQMAKSMDWRERAAAMFVIDQIAGKTHDQEVLDRIGSLLFEVFIPFIRNHDPENYFIGIDHLFKTGILVHSPDVLTEMISLILDKDEATSNAAVRSAQDFSGQEIGRLLCSADEKQLPEIISKLIKMNADGDYAPLALYTLCREYGPGILFRTIRGVVQESKLGSAALTKAKRSLTELYKQCFAESRVGKTSVPLYGDVLASSFKPPKVRAFRNSARRACA